MGSIKEVLPLKWTCGLSDRQIAKSCSIARSTVGEYSRRAEKAGLQWSLPEGMHNSQFDAFLFPVAPLVCSGAPYLLSKSRANDSRIK
jgi:hypothetical protein